jgi:hypothetical protein
MKNLFFLLIFVLASALSFDIAFASTAYDKATKEFLSQDGTALESGVAGTVKYCGELRPTETVQSPRDYDVETGETDSYYELRLDCNWNGDVTNSRRWLKLPLVTRNPMSQREMNHKSWLSRYLNQARTQGGPGAAPYLCVQAYAKQDPCVNRVQKTQAGFYRMTSQIKKFTSQFGN